MSDARNIYVELFKLASASREVRLVKEAFAPSSLTKVLGGAGLLTGAGLLGHAIGKSRGRAEAKKKQISPALLFGGGLATGLIGPKLFGGMLGLTPNSREFTSL